MSTGPTASVIIVSRDRPRLLRRACLGVWQQRHRPLELIVVADAAGRAALADLPFVDRLILADNPRPNIAEARNAGLDLAAGEVAAFLDDDAVPEPTWLSRLVAPLAEDAVAATTGTVLGRNGFGVQWGRESVDRLGRSQADPVGPPRLHGTNFAMRVEILRRLGGFDPGYGFFLDETDLTLRLSGAGYRVAHVDDALVVHGFAESPRRRADRVPRSLFEIGASTAFFLRRHAEPSLHRARLDGVRAEQFDRLDRHLLAGRIEPRDLRGLMRDLEAGMAAGAARDLDPLSPRGDAGRPFRPLLEMPPAEALFLAGPAFTAPALRARALAEAPSHVSVTLLLLGRGLSRHQMAFTDAGIWEQRGGLRGRSHRDRPVAGGASLDARADLERRLLADRRGPFGQTPVSGA